MFDIDQFVADCQAAVARDDALRSVKEVLERAMSDPAGVSKALPLERAEIVPLHVSPEVTILKVVWAPSMSFRPHNHLMWAAIGLYAGQEDNTFYRRGPGTIQESGGRQIRAGEVALLGSDAIHRVANPLQSYAGAIHIYGGDLPHATGRSEWAEPSLEEVAYDFDRTVRHFAAANA